MNKPNNVMNLLECALMENDFVSVKFNSNINITKRG